MIIRPAHESDYDEIALVWYEGYLASAVPGEPPYATREELRDRIPNDLQARAWDLFVAETDRQIVAMLAIIRREKTLDQIFVGDLMRGRGVGKLLLDFVKHEMPDGFWLRTHIRNTGAQGFYAHEGLVHTHDAPHPRHPEATFRYYAWKDQGISARNGCAG